MSVGTVADKMHQILRQWCQTEIVNIKINLCEDVVAQYNKT